MASTRRFSQASRAALDEAFGPKNAATLSASQMAMRELALRFTGLGGMPAVSDPAVWARVAAPLAAEFEAGEMPASRQALFLAALLESEHGWLGEVGRPLAPLVELGAKIATQAKPPFPWGGAFAFGAERPMGSCSVERAGGFDRLDLREETEDLLLAPSASRSQPLLHSFFRERAFPLQQAVSQLGGIPRSALGKDPARLLLAACATQDKGSLDFPATDAPKLFDREMSRLGLYDETAPSSDKTPMLSLLLDLAGSEREKLLRNEWLSLLAKQASREWLRFDHQTTAWPSDHPLASLALALRELDGIEGMPAAIEAITSLGYAPDWSFPSGKPPAKAPPQGAPNALWLFAGRADLFEEAPAAIAALLRAGADPAARAPADWRGERSLLSLINERAIQAPHGATRPQAQARLALAFQALVAAGADPLDVFPRPDTQDVCEGGMRRIVASALERKELLRFANEVDPSELAEALAFVRERRALANLAKARASEDPGQNAAPRPAGVSGAESSPSAAKPAAPGRRL
jgi:hypothetical protein